MISGAQLDIRHRSSSRQVARPTRRTAQTMATRRALASCSVVVAPGLNGSGGDHWQSEWQRLFPRFARISLDDWRSPDLDRWARAIVEAALTQNQPVIVVAHSFGCLAAIKASTLQSGLIAGALLVAPADPARFQLDEALQNIVPDFPSVLVLSENDRWMSLDQAWRWALQWDSQQVSLGAAGHINAQSGHHTWHTGLDLLEQLCRRVVSR